MENPSYIALSHQMALRRQMDVIANNIANVSTPSFKAERMLFEEVAAGRAPYPASGRAQLSFVRDIGTLRDTAAGALIPTGNALDLAINGPGYFVVETPAGPRYTRQSSFRLDQEGRIVTSEGFALLDESDRPITVRPGESRIEITPNGTISTEAGVIGKLRLVSFADEQAMRRLGSGLYETDQQAQPADAKTEVRQGAVEGSNVQAVLEITSMIEVMRRYQSAQRIVESEHELERRAIEKLSRVG